jgi:hypothetical protein
VLGLSVTRAEIGAIVRRALPLVLASSTLARAAGAAPPGQPFRLEYWAQGQCPDAVEFARQIQTRAPRLRLAEGAEPALGFYAELDARSGSAKGTLTARSPDGREVRREVRGSTCDDVVTALALIAALAADPAQPITAPHAASAAEVPSPVRARRPSPALEPAQEYPVPSDAEGGADPARRWTFGLGAGLAFDSSIAPSPGYGLSIAVDAEGPGGSALRPQLGLSLNRAVAGRTEAGASIASFTWLAFRLTACPLRWPEQTPLFIRPCVFLDAGELEGSVWLETQHSDTSHAWFGLGAFGRVEALVGESLSFQLDGGLSAPLEHEEFRAGPGASLAFRVPQAGFLGKIGLSYRFQ